MDATLARTLYLDLLVYLDAQDNNKTPFTQSIQTFYALDEALEEMIEFGGWKNRQEKYQNLMNIVRTELEKLKIKPCLEENESSCVLNSFYLPEGISYEKLHDELKEAGFIIYAGQGGLKKSFFRISCMGDISETDIKRFIMAIKKIVSVK
jgi:2-aminoethylphosphonate-pyruvate transaminase